MSTCKELLCYIFRIIFIFRRTLRKDDAIAKLQKNENDGDWWLVGQQKRRNAILLSRQLPLSPDERKNVSLNENDQLAFWCGKA